MLDIIEIEIEISPTSWNEIWACRLYIWCGYKNVRYSVKNSKIRSCFCEEIITGESFEGKTCQIFLLCSNIFLHILRFCKVLLRIKIFSQWQVPKSETRKCKRIKLWRTWRKIQVSRRVEIRTYVEVMSSSTWGIRKYSKWREEFVCNKWLNINEDLA
jgi:hypothetical protein